MATLADASVLNKYFDSAKHSDVTIELQGRNIKAHKLVLSAGSDYFRACFEGDFKEAQSTKLRLHDDDPSPMADLISSLYGYDLSYSDDKVLETWSQDFENFRHFVGVYVVAQKYLVPTLCVETKELFCGLLENLPPHDTHSTIFARIVQHVYAGLRDEATDLREPVIAHFTEHVKDINENSVFKGLLTTFPEFAMEVTAMPMQQKHDGSGGRPGTAKKRKMIIKTGNKR